MFVVPLISEVDQATYALRDVKELHRVLLKINKLVKKFTSKAWMREYPTTVILPEGVCTMD